MKVKFSVPWIIISVGLSILQEGSFHRIGNFAELGL